MREFEFVHRFIDSSAEGSLSIDTRAPKTAHIEVSVDSAGAIWISANRDGWLHLACIAAELGTSNYEPGFHIHMTPDFSNWSEGTKPEVSLEVAG